MCGCGVWLTRTGYSGTWRSTPRCPTLSRAARRIAPELWYKATTSTTGTYSSNLTNTVHRPRVFSFHLQAFPFPSLTHLPFPCLSSLILSTTPNLPPVFFSHLHIHLPQLPTFFSPRTIMFTFHNTNLLHSSHIHF